MTAPLAGETVLASHYPKVQLIAKSADESLTSSTTLQDDNHFTVTLLADRVYMIDLYLGFRAATAGDIKTAWSISGGVAQKVARHVQGPTLGTTDVLATSLVARTQTITTAQPYGHDGSGNGGSIQEHFVVETTTAGAGGTLTLQWAQNASSGTATVVLSASYMVITEIDEL